MLSNPTTRPTLPVGYKPAPAHKPGASQKLEQARNRIRFAQRSVTASEGRLLDYDTAEEIGRALSTAARELEQLSIQVSIMERKVR